MESSLPDEYRYSEEYIQQEQEYIDNEWKNDVSQNDEGHNNNDNIKKLRAIKLDLENKYSMIVSEFTDRLSGAVQALQNELPKHAITGLDYLESRIDNLQNIINSNSEELQKFKKATEVSSSFVKAINQ